MIIIALFKLNLQEIIMIEIYVDKLFPKLLSPMNLSGQIESKKQYFVVEIFCPKSFRPRIFYGLNNLSTIIIFMDEILRLQYVRQLRTEIIRPKIIGIRSTFANFCGRISPSRTKESHFRDINCRP